MPKTPNLAEMASLFLPVQAVRQPPTAPPHALITEPVDSRNAVWEV